MIERASACPTQFCPPQYCSVIVPFNIVHPIWLSGPVIVPPTSNIVVNWEHNVKAVYDDGIENQSFNWVDQLLIEGKLSSVMSSKT